jgi:integrase
VRAPRRPASPRAARNAGEAAVGPGKRARTTTPVRARSASETPPPSSPPPTGLQLHAADERDGFLHAAESADGDVRTLCMTLTYAGCRLSEALALTADRVDLAAGVLVFETLKTRSPGIYRAMPVPPALFDALDWVHGIRELQRRHGKTSGVRLWPWSRMTGACGRSTACPPGKALPTRRRWSSRARAFIAGQF